MWSGSFDFVEFATQMVPYLPLYGAWGLGMLVAVLHIVIGRQVRPAIVLLIGLFGMSAVQAIWVGLSVATMVSQTADLWYSSWASTAVDVLLVGMDAVFLAITLSAAFVGRLGVKP